MESGSKNFWNDLKLFNNNIALLDTSKTKTFSYSDLHSEVEFLVSKINPVKKD